MALLALLSIVLQAQASPYTLTDVLDDLAPGKTGHGAVTQFARLMERTDLRNIEDPKTEAFFRYLRSVLENFDFMKIWKGPFCDDFGGGYRGLRLMGCASGDSFSIKLTAPSEKGCAGQDAGNFDTVYAFRLNEKSVAGGRSFVVDMRSERNMGRISHRTVLRLAEGLLKVIDPDNLAMLNAPDCPYHPAVTGISRRVINQFNRDLPQLSALFDRYAAVHSLLSVEDRNGVQYTRLDFRYGYKLEALKKDLPALAKSLKAIEGLYRIVMTVKNDRGHEVMRIVFDSRKDALGLSLLTRGGKIVPVDGSGEPVSGETVSLPDLTDISYYAEFTMLHDVHGLKFTTDSMRVGFTFRDTPAEGVWTMKLDEVSPTRISGLFYNIIPPWLINVFIPSNMAQLIQDLSQVMLMADGGSGSRVIYRWDTRDPENVRQRFRGTSEFIDNFFMNFGLKTWSRSSVADSKLTSEVQALTSQFLRALKADCGIM